MMNKSVIKIGRGHDCDVRISDISVSRFHATMSIQDNKFYIEDHKSKFGTLVQMKRPIVLDPSDALAFQIGRSLVEVKIKKPWSLIPACFRSENRYDPYNVTASPGEPLLLPFNNGIPLAIHDP
jgi:predicted component of type VI protein secretion system